MPDTNNEHPFVAGQMVRNTCRESLFFGCVGTVQYAWPAGSERRKFFWSVVVWENPVTGVPPAGSGPPGSTYAHDDLEPWNG